MTEVVVAVEVQVLAIVGGGVVGPPNPWASHCMLGNVALGHQVAHYQHHLRPLGLQWPRLPEGLWQSQVLQRGVGPVGGHLPPLGCQGVAYHEPD